MIRSTLAALVRSAVASLQAEGYLPAGLDAPIEIAEPAKPEHGDFACNYALMASKSAGKNPREIAVRLSETLALCPELASVEVAGPGFLNLRLSPSFVASSVEEVLAKGADFARAVAEVPLKINVEFVSVNPNGPITIGSGRGAAFGSTLCNVLEAAGHEVHREYYINDGVNSEQMRLFATSVIDLVERLLYHEIGPDRLGQAEMSRLDDLRNEFLRSLGPGRGGYEANWFREQYRDWLKGRPMSEPFVSRERERAEVPGRYSVGETVMLRYRRSYAENAFVPWNRDYRGDYVADVARRLKEATAFEELEEKLSSNDEYWFQSASQTIMLAKQREDLAAFGVWFDTWFSEQSLHESGKVEAAVAALFANDSADDRAERLKLKLAKKGAVEDVEIEAQPTDEDDAEGAGKTLWLRSTKYGDDQDRVLKRRDGRFTYIASDVAYHKDKFNRPPNADKLMTVLGPDHHGYIGRLTAVVAAIARKEETGKVDGALLDWEGKVFDSPEERDVCKAALEEAKRRLEVVIFQLVRFMKDGQPAPMRKRDGNIYALIDLIKEIGQAAAPEADAEEQTRIGRDVARFFYLMRSHETHLDFDLDLATKQSDDNPVYYVQYAHARICSLIEKASEAGFAPGDPAAFEDPREIALVKKICDLPFEIERTAQDYGVHRIATYAVELARAYHHFYDGCRVIQPEHPEQTRSRLALCRATQIGLQAAFGILGISAPTRM